MKKRICFAGFPGEEVSALQIVTTDNAIGECRFAPTADAVLTLLASENYDVCVANMSMPGKNGAELLRELGRLHPKTLGFIVGDVADQALIINCIGGPHQFIRRPFEAANLLTSLQRGLRLDAWLASDELRKLMPRLRRLPSLPATYFNLVKEMESPATTLQDIGTIIERDPVITARLLQMVNSAAFSLAQKVTQPTDAAGLLGLQTIKSLVMCLQIFGQGDEARDTGLSLEILWEHSFLVAKFARQIALKQTGDARLADDAFTAGLLHDVGRLVLASNLPKEYAAVVAAAREKSCPLHEEETAQLGVNHAKVGAYLLGLWGLPAPFIEAAAAHHGPGQTVFACEFSLLAAVHAANVFAHAASGRTDGLPLPQLDIAYYRVLKLDDQLLGWRKACTGELPSAPAAPPPIPPAPDSAAALSAPLAQSPAKAVAATEPSDPVARPPAKGEPPSRSSSRPAPVAWLWRLAGALLVVAIGLLAWWWSKPAPPETPAIAPSVARAVSALPVPTPTPTNHPAAPTNSKPANAVPVAAKAAPNPLDTVKVQGVFYRSAKPLAIVNNQPVAVGESFRGISVVAINQDSVTLSYHGEQKVYPIK
jgi:HD-like signal output (HDOD) protein